MNRLGSIGKVEVNGEWVKGEHELFMSAYIDGSPALFLIKDGEVACKVTACVKGAPLGEGEFLVKGYSENEGVIESLLESGHLIDTGKAYASGHAYMKVCKLADHLTPAVP